MGVSRWTGGLYALLALASSVNGRVGHSSRRSLQTTAVWVEKVTGTEILADQRDGTQIGAAEGGAITDVSKSVAFGNGASGQAAYELYFKAPAAVTGPITITIVAQLGGTATAADWKVDMFSFLPARRQTWVPVGDLTGVQVGEWTTVTLTLETERPAKLVESTVNEFLVRLRTNGAAANSIVYVDEMVVSDGTPGSPSPGPPTPGPTSPGPPAPGPQSPGSSAGATAVFVEQVSGTDLLVSQVGGVQLATAEKADVTDAMKSIAFGASEQAQAWYAMFFKAPGAVSGPYTITITAQLGAGANGGNWKVDMYSFLPANADKFVAAGDLSGASAGEWTTITLTVDTETPENFVEPSVSEYLVRLSTTDAVGPEVVYLDEVVVSTQAAPTPVPGPPSPAPLPPTAGATAVFVERISGTPIIIPGQVGGVQLTTAEEADVTDDTKSVAFGAVDSTQQGAYAMFFKAPTSVSGGYTITITAQLGDGANAENWKVDMYSFLPANGDKYIPVGDFTGVVAGSWTTITLTLETEAPTNFVEPTVNEYLLRISSEGATNPETIYVDEIVISSGDITPAPAPVAGPTAEPVAPIAPTTPEGSVLVDLVPCIFAPEPLVRDISAVASAYLMNEFYKGFWTATQEVQAPPANVLDLYVDENPDHGKCSVIFVGIKPTAAQKLQLQDYSRKFKVRLVYFQAAETFTDTEVQTRLGMKDNFEDPSFGAARVKRTGGPADSVVPADLMTNPTRSNLFNIPVVQNVPTLPAGVSIIAQYADASGTVIRGGNENAGIVEYIGGDGLEEMHVFISLAWFDAGSYSWAHFISEWGTKGVFQGERRFYLGGVVDDLFLNTGQWIYDPPFFYGPEERLSGADLEKYKNSEARFNAQYGAAIKTEHAFNGLGILDKIGSPRKSWTGVDADIALLPKGENPTPPTGIPRVSIPNWLSITFNPAEGQRGMKDDFDDGLFDSDDLLANVRANLDAFYWQSHTLTHLARDNLGKGDCDVEDAGNTQMAILLGLYDSDNYNWRSMTSPGITGLFNPNCLRSGAEQLMKCYPGDNTFSGAPLTEVSLINNDNQFHPITTTLETNGYAGAEIVPRWATYIYYNCVTGKCLVDENEKIRRDVCGCEELNPALPRGTCSLCEGSIQSFVDQAAEASTPIGPLEALYQVEAQTTTKYLLAGRRDKYMFHQANVISTPWATDPDDPLYVNPRPENNPSLLEYWYIRVLAEMTKYINTGSFPVQTLKFDNLCWNFYEHEDLDKSGAVLTARKNAAGDITGMRLTTVNQNGAPIPLTVPTAQAAALENNLGNLSPSKTEAYGIDTTFTFNAGTPTGGDLSDPSRRALQAIRQRDGNLSKPNRSELPPLPDVGLRKETQEEEQVEGEIALDVEISSIADVAEEARVEIEQETGLQGFVVEDMVGKIVPEPVEDIPGTPAPLFAAFTDAPIFDLFTPSPIAPPTPAPVVPVPTPAAVTFAPVAALAPRATASPNRAPTQSPIVILGDNPVVPAPPVVFAPPSAAPVGRSTAAPAEESTAAPAVTLSPGASAAPVEGSTAAPAVPPGPGVTAAPIEGSTLSPTVPAGAGGTATPSDGATLAPAVPAGAGETAAPSDGATLAPAVPAGAGETAAPSDGATLAPAVPAGVGETLAPRDGATLAPAVPAGAGGTAAPIIGETAAPTIGETAVPTIGATLAPALPV